MYKYFYLFFICSSLFIFADSKKPNIVFILTDDQRFDNLSCYGNKLIKTPHLDTLAEQGTRFSEMFVTTSICATSRASIFSGLNETTHGFTFGKPPVSEKIMNSSYPILLRKNGYKTGFTGKFGVRLAKNKEKIKEMFDVYKSFGGPRHYKQKDGSLRHSTELNGDNACDMMEQFKDGPFCISVSFGATHAVDGNKKPGDGHFPWPKATNGMYEDITFPTPLHDTEEYRKTLPEFFTNPDTSMNRFRYYWRWDEPEKFQINMRAYARMTTGIDNVVGRMRAKLKELKLDQNTIIIYTADNGFFMGNRGFAGKWSHWEESLRVPLIIHDPRNTKTQVSKKISLNIDLTPTILEYAGIEIPKHYQGRSLKGIVDGKAPAAWRTSFFCEHHMNNKQIPKWEGIRNERFTYAHYYERDYEFFHDREKDPQQLRNLINDPEYKPIIEKMRAERKAKKKEFLANPIRK